MIIPNKIRIGGVDYTVKYVENLNDGEHLLYGQIDFETAEIRISTRKCDYQHKCITMLHEILHGITNAYNIVLDSDKEEKIIDSFAKGIYQVLQDNRKILL